MKYKDKVQKCYRYRKLVWEDELNSLGYRRYHYENNYSIRFYGPVFRYRFDPVPGTGGSGKTYILKYFRHMRTTQELRWYYAHKDEVKIRGRRTPRFLSSAWDDIPYGRKEKGWKRTKKKRQWM